MTVKRLTLCLLALAVATAPAKVTAQAFGLNEIGTCALARGFAATGAPCNDASVLFWNPAAATRLSGLSVYAGAAGVSLAGTFQADYTGFEEENDAPVEVPPHVFVNYRRGRLAYGLGVYVPYGLTSEWKDDFSGRFSVLRASLATIYIQPNIAFDIVPDRVSIGGGPVIGRSSVELKQALDLSTVATPLGPTLGQLGIAPGTEFGVASLEGDAIAYGFHVGLHARVSPTVQLGARYLSSLKFEYDDAEATFTQTLTGLVLGGTVAPPFVAGTEVDQLVQGQFSGTGLLTSQKVSTRITHPLQFAVGLGYTGLPNTTLTADYNLIGWRAFDVLPVNFENAPDQELIEDYVDAWAIRTGAEYIFGNGFAGRAGFSFAKTPAPDETVTALLPDQDRFNYSLGVGIPIAGRFALDAGYLRVDTQGRRGRIADRASRDQTAQTLNTGFYTLDANIFSLSLKAQF
jgi:long-chain fatty acid transport protein